MTHRTSALAILLCATFGACDREGRSAPVSSSVVPAPSLAQAEKREAVARPEPSAAQLDVDPRPELGPSEQEVMELREAIARSHSRGPRPFEASPEFFAKSMKGSLECGKKKCVAGRQVCVVSPSEDHPAHCEGIREWIDHHTPVPRGGFPPLAGITVCGGSDNCPASSVCCLHMLGMAEVQTIACHTSLDECSPQGEICSGKRADECRTPGTECRDGACVPKLGDASAASM